MRHLKKGRKFGRKTDIRRALLRSLAFNLISKEKIKTTEAKAKDLRSFIEKLITKAKIETLANKRLVISKIGKASAAKLFNKIAPKYKEKNGGYTRILKLSARKGDAGKMALIEFV